MASASLGQDLTLDLRLDAANGFATLAGSIGAWTKPGEARLDLSVDIDLPDLGQFALLVPAVEELKGGVEATIRAGGSLAEPELTGQAKVSYRREAGDAKIPKENQKKEEP